MLGLAGFLSLSDVFVFEELSFFEDVFDLVSSFFSVLPLLLLFLLDTVVFTSSTLTVTVLPSSVFTSTLPSFTSTFLPFLSVMLPSLSIFRPLSSIALLTSDDTVEVCTVEVCTVENITDGSVGSFSALQPARMLMPTANVPASIVAPQTTAITLVFTVAVAVAFTIDETVDFAPVAKPFVADVASVCQFGSLIVMFGTARLFASSLKIVVKNGTNTTP